MQLDKNFIRLCFRRKFEKKILLLVCTGNGSRKKNEKVKFCETTTLHGLSPRFHDFFHGSFSCFEGYAIWPQSQCM